MSKNHENEEFPLQNPESAEEIQMKEFQELSEQIEKESKQEENNEEFKDKDPLQLEEIKEEEPVHNLNVEEKTGENINEKHEETEENITEKPEENQENPNKKPEEDQQNFNEKHEENKDYFNEKPEENPNENQQNLNEKPEEKPPLKAISKPKKPNLPNKPKPKPFNTSESSEIPVKNLDIDEIPIGKSSAFTVSEYPPDYQENPNNLPIADSSVNIPLSERLKSKIWKIRQLAFEELAINFEEMDFSTINSMFSFIEMTKFIGDSNPGSQEKALLAYKIYLNKLKKIEENLEETFKILFEKVLITQKMKKIGIETLFLIFEKSADKKDFSSVFLTLLTNKNPKTVSITISAFVELFQTFGVRKLDFLKNWLPEIEKLASNSNVAGIKVECLNFFKEAYRFLGPELIKANISKLKKAQIDEISQFIEENPFISTIKALKPDEEEEKFYEKSKNSKDLSVFDPFEISDPIDIFVKFNENWTNKVLNFEKWNERKEALEDFLRENASIIRISSNSHAISSYNSMLKRLLLDSNLQVIISAIKIIAFLCKTLRKAFFSQAKALFPFLLEKFKEKKGILLEETQKTMENVLFCLNLEEVLDMVKETLDSKNVQSKLNGLIWIEKALIKSENPLGLKGIMPVFKKLMDDGSNEVRTSMMNLLGRLVGKVGNERKAIIMSEIPSGKIVKFEEIVKKSEEIVKKSEEIVKKNIDKNNEKNVETKNNDKIDEIPKKNTDKIDEISKKNEEIQKKNQVKKPVFEEISTFEEIINIPEEEAERILREKGLKDEVLKGLSSSDWKEKQKAIMSFSENMDIILMNLEEFLVVLRGKLKNFKENNLNIMKELFVFLVNDDFLQKIDKKCFNVISGLLVEKMGDSKFSEQISQILCKSSRKISLKFIIPNIIQRISSGKPLNSSKIISETFEIFNKLLLFVANSKESPLKDIAGFIKPMLGSTNPVIKAGLVGFLQNLMDLHGKNVIEGVLGEIPVNLLKNLKFEEEKIEKNEEKTEISDKKNMKKTEENKEEINEEICKKSEKKTEEKEKKKVFLKKNPVIDKETSSNSKETKENPKETVKESVFSKKIADSKANLLLKPSLQAEISRIFLKLKDKEWNKRKEALEELEKLDFSLVMKLPNTINELLNLLKIRIIDPNKPLARQFVIFLGNFVKFFDKDSLKPHQKQLLMSLLTNLSDKNAVIRNEIMVSLDNFAKISGSDAIINMISQYYLNNDSPEIKHELLNFLIKQDFSSEKIEFKHLVSPVLASLIDKNKEIRRNSEVLLKKILEKTGRNLFVFTIKDLKPAVRNQIEAIFERISEEKHNEKSGEKNDKFVENNEKSFEENSKKSLKSINNSLRKESNPIVNKEEIEEKQQESLKEEEKIYSFDWEAFSKGFLLDVEKMQEMKKKRMEKYDKITEIPHENVKKNLEETFLLQKNEDFSKKNISENIAEKIDFFEDLSKKNTEEKTMKKILQKENLEFSLKTPKKPAIFPKKTEVFHCLLSPLSCLQAHSQNCPLQAILSPKNDYLIYEVFPSEIPNFSMFLKSEFYEKLYQENEWESLKFLYNFFEFLLSSEKSIELQQIDEISDLFTQYLTFLLIKSYETTEETVILSLETLIFLIKIIRFNCNHLKLFEVLFLVNAIKVFFEKSLDSNSTIFSTFKTFFLAVICNTKDLKPLQNLFIIAFLNSDSSDWSFRYKILRVLNELLFDYSEPNIDFLSNLPEFYGDNETLSRFVQKFNEEELMKKGGFSRNQLLFARKIQHSDSKNQELDNMINETKNSIIRRTTHGNSAFFSRSLLENLKYEEESMKTARNSAEKKYNEKNFNEKNYNEKNYNEKNIEKNNEKNTEKNNEKNTPKNNGKTSKNPSNEKISIKEDIFSDKRNSAEKIFEFSSIPEELLKNPIVNQQITSELFLADLKLLEVGNPAQKIDALMFLNDLATSGLPEHNLLFQRHSDQILISFLLVFKTAFSLESRLLRNERNPLQFLQYFLNMLQKFISSGLFLRFVQEKSLIKEFLEELCMKMLWEESFLLKNSSFVINSGVMLLKLMNIIVLRCLEYGDYCSVIEGLLQLLYKYRKLNANCYRKLFGLVGKCLLKLAKHMTVLKENIVNYEGIIVFFKLFYQYLNEFYGVDKKKGWFIEKNEEGKGEDLGIMTIKSVLFEVCKAFGEKVWDFYKKIELKGNKNDYLLEK